LYVEISFFVHATEDPEKCMKAIREVLPGTQDVAVIVDEEVLQGYYDNPIRIIKADISDERVIRVFLENMSNRLELDDKKRLYSELEDHISDKKTLYLRFDKQEAYLGNMKLGQQDPIHVKIKLQGRTLERADIYTLLGLQT
jgi:RNA binding exosome subunit